MLRDIALVENDRLESTDSRVGVLASEIPSGFSLPAFLLNDVDANAPNRLYSLKITSLPSAGDLFLNKAGVGTFTGAPVGVYTGTQVIEKFDPGIGLVSRASSTYTLTIAAPAEAPPRVTSVVISPRGGNGSQKFTAQVLGTNNPSQAVTWTKAGPGTLSADGDFVAPARTTVDQVISIKATSVLDPTMFDSVTIIIAALVVNEVPPEVLGVEVSPTGLLLLGGSSQQLTARVIGNGNISQDVLWEVDRGTITATGMVTMPPAVAGVQEVNAKATSIQNPTKSGTVKILVQALGDINPHDIVLSPARILKTAANNWKERISYNEKDGDTFYLSQGLWCIDKDPDDHLYYALDLIPYLESIGAGISSVIGLVEGVQLLMGPFVRDRLIIVKIGGGNRSASVDAVNSLTLRISCSNGEVVDKSIYFVMKDN